MRVRELAEWLGATYEGDGEKELSGVAPVETAGASDVAFIGSRKAAQEAERSAAGCLLVPMEWPSPSYRTVIRVPEPRPAFARAMSRFYPTAELKPGVNELVLAQGGTPRFDAEAGVDAWRDLLQFLEEGASRHAP